MRAAVCYEFNAPLSVEEVRLEAPREGEVAVRMAATAICHSDIHYLKGERDAQPPLVVGHEGAGIVESIGPEVTRVKPGDRVVLSLLRNCGKCWFCERGQPYHCSGDFALAHATRLYNTQGQMLGDGDLGAQAFAEDAVVHESQVVPVPDWLHLDRAALLACGVITGAGAAINTAGIRPGDSVVVIGAGGVGLNAIQGAAIAGAETIVAIDPQPTKLQAAVEFGATHGVRRSGPEAIDLIRSLTAGRGADYVLVTVGVPEAVRDAFPLLRTAGTMVLVGLPAPGTTTPLPIREVAWAGQRIIGSCMGSTRLHVDIPWLVSLHEQGRLKLDELISHRFPLEDINTAIEEVLRGEVRRNVIVFDRSLV